VRIAGGLLFAVGALSLGATLSTRTDVDYTWADWAAPAAVMVVGVGFAAVRAGGDITHPGLGPIGVLFVLLGAVLLAMLLTFPTLRWFAERWLARRGK
jgi:drug/metabolite transporter (DMT)-like permease